MKLLLTLSGPLASEEALFARRFLQQAGGNVEALALSPFVPAYYLFDDPTQPASCPWGVLAWQEDRRPALEQALAFQPDLVVVSDPPATDDALMEALSGLGVPMIGLDTVGMPSSIAVDGWIRACPPLEAKPDQASWRAFDGLVAALQRYESRAELVERHGAPADSLIVVMPFSLPIQILAGARLLKPWYQTMVEAVCHHLQSLERPVLLVVVSPGCAVEPGERGNVRLVAYDELVPPLLERTMAAADLVIVEQAWRFWRHQALSQGVPVAVIANSVFQREDGLVTLFGKVAPPMRPLLDELESAAPHALFPFTNFPAPTDQWPTEAYVPESLWARLDIFDQAGCAAVLQQLLSNDARWQQSVEAFLNQGRGALPVPKLLQQALKSPSRRS